MTTPLRSNDPLYRIVGLLLDSPRNPQESWKEWCGRVGVELLDEEMCLKLLEHAEYHIFLPSNEVLVFLRSTAAK